MNIVVVYESMFGNTHQIAEAIANGVQEAASHAQVTLLPVADADPQTVQAADLLIVGGPTHMRGMSSGMSRKMGISAEEKLEEAERHELEPEAEGPGVRDWFDKLPKATKPSKAAAFDTRAAQRLAGGAAHGISRRLRRHGYDVVADEGFIIEDMQGPLKSGETDRAKAWAADLVRSASVTA